MHPVILKEQHDTIAGEMVTIIQTDEDREYSKKHNVRKFSELIYRGKRITDQNEINKILSCHPA